MSAAAAFRSIEPRLVGSFSDTERHCVSFTDRKNVQWLSEPHTAHENTDDDTLRQDVEAAIRDVGDTALSRQDCPTS